MKRVPTGKRPLPKQGEAGEEEDEDEDEDEDGEEEDEEAEAEERKERDLAKTSFNSLFSKLSRKSPSGQGSGSGGSGIARTSMTGGQGIARTSMTGGGGGPSVARASMLGGGKGGTPQAPPGFARPSMSGVSRSTLPGAVRISGSGAAAAGEKKGCCVVS